LSKGRNAERRPRVFALADESIRNLLREKIMTIETFNKKISALNKELFELRILLEQRRKSREKMSTQQEINYLLEILSVENKRENLLANKLGMTGEV
jgi:predicted  nucleic acid-binding Zn-ribbon protein